jgi:hypothetical protein
LLQATASIPSKSRRARLVWKAVALFGRRLAPISVCFNSLASIVPLLSLSNLACREAANQMATKTGATVALHAGVAVPIQETKLPHSGADEQPFYEPRKGLAAFVNLILGKHSWVS